MLYHVYGENRLIIFQLGKTNLRAYFEKPFVVGGRYEYIHSGFFEFKNIKFDSLDYKYKNKEVEYLNYLYCGLTYRFKPNNIGLNTLLHLCKNYDKESQDFILLNLDFFEKVINQTLEQMPTIKQEDNDENRSKLEASI